MLTAHHVLYGYTIGIFPMADSETNEINWYEPKKRGVIFLESANIPKSVKKEMVSGKFELKINNNFSEVIRLCAEREETWISEEIIEVYEALYTMGYGYSFEVWQKKKLIGGLYGVALNKIFFGESMFHKVSNASKIALAFCINTLQQNNFYMIDTQYSTSHLRQFNTQEIEQSEYLKELQFALG